MSNEWRQVGSDPLFIKDLSWAAVELIKESRNHNVWLLRGEMGVGKTTLVKEVVVALKIDAIVASPTYSIVNQYGNEEGSIVYHFDLYRLKNETEAFDLGMDEYLNSGNKCLIEWPDKLDQLLPDKYFEIQIRPNDSLTRKIYYRTHE